MEPAFKCSQLWFWFWFELQMACTLLLCRGIKYSSQDTYKLRKAFKLLLADLSRSQLIRGRAQSIILKIDPSHGQYWTQNLSQIPIPYQSWSSIVFEQEKTQGCHECKSLCFICWISLYWPRNFSVSSTRRLVWCWWYNCWACYIAWHWSLSWKSKVKMCPRPSPISCPKQTLSDTEIENADFFFQIWCRAKFKIFLGKYSRRHGLTSY